MMVMAGLCALFTCCFVIFFHTPYRRLEAEERDKYGSGNGVQQPPPEETH